MSRRGWSWVQHRVFSVGVRLVGGGLVVRDRWLGRIKPEALAGQEKSGRHVVVFVQEAGYGRVLAVESHAL